MKSRPDRKVAARASSTLRAGPARSILDDAKARATAAGVPVTRPIRAESLMELAGLGLMGPELPAALKLATRARFVQYAPVDKRLAKLHRLRKLELGGEMPPWIGGLRNLRTLICHAPAKLPASLLTLPHLRFLHLDGSPELASLDGIEKLKALETVTCSNTPLAEEPGALEALAKRLGAKADPFLPGLDFKRVAPAAPKSKKVLARAINDDTLPNASNLRRVDLSGSTFKDAYISHDLRGAKLANTVWIACDFEWAHLGGADLTGALFYDCYFRSDHVEGNLPKVKARGATFIGCGGTLTFKVADLRDAAFVDMDPDYGLDLDKANARNMYLSGQFCSEREHRWSAKGADLRGATIQLDVTSGRRTELQNKKTARLAWKTDHLKGAKTDSTTHIEHAPLDPRPTAAAPTRAPESTVDPKGQAAPILGRIYASNASLWLIVADADVAQHWRGAIDDDNEDDDFQRALRESDGSIEIGDDAGVRVEIGARSGWSHLFGSTDRGSSIRLVDAALHDDEDRSALDRAMALRMGQWPITTRPKRVGTFACRSGVVALMLPYTSGAFPRAMRAKAKPGKAIIEPREANRALVALKPGLYEVSRYRFAPEKGRGDYEDELGEYGDVVEISYRDALRT